MVAELVNYEHEIFIKENLQKFVLSFLNKNAILRGVHTPTNFAYHTSQQLENNLTDLLDQK